MPYAPPGNQVGTATLTHQATVYYDRRGLDKLKFMCRFAQICEPKPLPRSSGRTIQFYRFSVPVANITPAADGVIGTALPLTSATISATVEEFNDFTSSSQLLEETDIAPFVEEMVDYMSTRAAYSTDTLARLEIDSASSAQVATIGAYFSAQDAKANVVRMKAVNVLPYQGEEFMGVMHPYSEYDLMSDNTAGGFIDALKYANGVQVLNGEVGKVGGVRWVTTTNVGTSGTAPNVLYYAYIFGARGVGMVDLSGSGPTQVADPLNERFQTHVTKGGPSAVDPAGTIGTYVAYRFVTAFKILDATNYRFRIVTADAQLV